MRDNNKKQPPCRARWLAGLAVGALMLPAAAQAETLQDALAKAYENNPTLTAARAGQRANDENVTIQKASGLPEVGARVDYQENLVLPGNAFFSPKRNVNVGGQVTVPIYQGGAVRNAIKAAFTLSAIRRSSSSTRRMFRSSAPICRRLATVSKSAT